MRMEKNVFCSRWESGFGILVYYKCNSFIVSATRFVDALFRYTIDVYCSLQIKNGILNEKVTQCCKLAMYRKGAPNCFWRWQICAKRKRQLRQLPNEANIFAESFRHKLSSKVCRFGCFSLLARRTSKLFLSLAMERIRKTSPRAFKASARGAGVAAEGRKWGTLHRTTLRNANIWNSSCVSFEWAPNLYETFVLIYFDSHIHTHRRHSRTL